MNHLLIDWYCWWLNGDWQYVPLSATNQTTKMSENIRRFLEILSFLNWTHRQSMIDWFTGGSESQAVETIVCLSRSFAKSFVNHKIFCIFVRISKVEIQSTNRSVWNIVLG